MNAFQPEQIIKTLNATQIKYLLKLTDTPCNSKMKKTLARKKAVKVAESGEAEPEPEVNEVSPSIESINLE